MAPSQRRPVPKPGKSSQNNGATEKASKPQIEQKNSPSFLMLLVLGFILLIAYTIWSSIETYSNTVVHDMD